MDLGTRHQLHSESLGQLLPLSVASFLHWMAHGKMSASLHFCLLLGPGQPEKGYCVVACSCMWILGVQAGT